MKKVLVFCLIVCAALLACSFGQAATSWYLPEGSTDNFDLWILVTNPTSTTASVTFTFYRSGASTLTQDATIDANSRYSLNVNSVSSMGATAVSSKVESTNMVNIYAERAMYWSTSNFPTWQGGHTARGISGLEGCYTELSQPSSFPITISNAGSYKFVENISITDNDTNAINITGSNVTLDLNGFTLTGPGYDQGDSGIGIYVYNEDASPQNVTIENGHIRNFRGNGLQAVGFNVNVTQINFYNNGAFGVYSVGGNGVIERCNFYANGQSESGGGIYASRMVIRDNSLQGNYGSGILVNTGTLITNNIVFSTADSTAVDNDAGINLLLTDNLLVNNIISAGADDVDGVRISSDDNLLAGNAVTANELGVYIGPAGDRNLLRDNHVTNNNSTPIQIAPGADNNCLLENTYTGAITDEGTGTVSTEYTGVTPAAAEARANCDLD